MDSTLLLSQVLNGLGNGLIYFLTAVGFTLVFGLMNFVNFAHGAFFVLGAYAAFELTGRGWSLWVVLLVAPFIVAAIAAIAERVLLRRMYRLAHTYQIVATLALAITVQEIVTLVWGANSFTLNAPESLSGTVDVGPVTYPWYRIFVVVLAAALTVLLWVLLERTTFGAKLRAGSERPDMIVCLGVNVFRLFSVTFALAAGLAALAGVLATPMRGMAPVTGNEVLGLAVVVVVIGGIGSFGGTLVAALAVAEVQSIAVIYAPAAGNVIVYVLMALVLLARSDVVMRRLSLA